MTTEVVQSAVADLEQRQRALNHAVSCIVQAPAGSGKTSLLTQRYLVLLSQVEQPEAILGITFTRKAAAEMVERVLAALRRAQNGDPPLATHEREAWQLARAVQQRDQERGWHLLENPNRLRLQTIDAFCTSLVRQMPVVSEFGAPVAIQTHSEALYQQAARQSLTEIDADGHWAASIKTLLRHLDNHVPKLEALLAQMLARRDQWLRHVSGAIQQTHLRAELEGVLQSIVRAAVEKAIEVIQKASLPKLDELLQFSASHLDDAKHPIAQAAKNTELADDLGAQKLYVLGVAKILLTDKDGWRQQVDKKLGFPAPSSAGAAKKQQYTAAKAEAVKLLEQASQNPELHEALKMVRCLPDTHYTENQWQVIEALLNLLPLAVAQLRLEFQRTASVDFCEMAHAAERALGDDVSPSDLALRMDYQIQHVLVDEFQDTSETQFALLSRLLSGWEPGKGRSLFLVGDPMQSIYRFRQAEVGLFLTAQQHGVGPMRPLEVLTLSVNFRAQAGLVDWFNQHLAQVFPEADDLQKGAIGYAPSGAFHPTLSGDPVSLHPIVGEAAELQEAESICEQVLAIQQQHPGDSVAILVRGRSALSAIIPALKAQGIAFAAQDIDALGEQSVIKDLWALTQALLHPADRIAWLTLLRAPWCGLTLVDLHQLVGDQPEACVWDLLREVERIGLLSADGQTRVQNVISVLSQVFQDRQRQPLADWVYGAWLALAGPACVKDEGALSDAQHYFELLSTLEQGGEVSRTELKQRVDALFATPRTGAVVQIMTIHKSKGLEFDHVLIPGLGRKAGIDSAPLLNWLELPREANDMKGGDMMDLLLAPIHAIGDEVDATSGYLKQLQQAKTDQELTRLLYVAMTRARKYLHLWFEISLDNQQAVKSPRKGSLLSTLWPAIETQVINRLSSVCDEACLSEINAKQNSEKNNINIRNIKRISDKFVSPTKPRSISWSPDRLLRETGVDALEFDWASDLARQIGVVCHQVLQWIATKGVETWGGWTTDLQNQYLLQALRDEGVLSAQIDEASTRIRKMIEATLKDNRGQWVLNRQHEQQACELAISGLIDGQVVHGVLDRTFVDEHGVRWIIDYKTGRHQGEDVDGFMDNEVERYRWQLERYAQLMRLKEKRPICLGLYFPAMAGWRQWEFVDDRDG